MNSLKLVENGDNNTMTSLELARAFNQRHDNVVKRLREMNVSSYRLVKYQDKQNKKQPMLVFGMDVALEYIATSRKDCSKILNWFKEGMKGEMPVIEEAVINETGYIYVFQSNGHYKIGKTTGNPLKRIKSCQTGNPYKITLLRSYPSIKISKDEEKLHEKYKDSRMEGEWFNLTFEDIMDIDSIMNKEY